MMEIPRIPFVAKFAIVYLFLRILLPFIVVEQVVESIGPLRVLIAVVIGIIWKLTESKDKIYEPTKDGDSAKIHITSSITQDDLIEGNQDVAFRINKNEISVKKI